MNAADLMTTPVIAIPSATPVAQAAALLLERGISGLPVIDHGRLQGVVSEGDLVRRLTPARRGGLLAAILHPGADARTYLADHGRTVGEVMTTPVHTVTPETSAADIAILMGRHGIKRVPVVDAAGQVVGIVTRANLLRALTAHPPQAAVSDRAIRAAFIAELGKTAWGRLLNPEGVIVGDGVIHLWGPVADAATRAALLAAAEATPGCRGVADHMTTPA